MTELGVRFWSKVSKNAPGECWLWSAGTCKDGYGRYRLDGVTYPAHRLSARESGLAVAGKHVCHTCDVPGCVNPLHLFVGTHQDNMRDRDAKGRGNTSSLCAADVVSIRAACAAGELHRVVAARHGISRVSVTTIVNRRTWRHV